RHGQLAQECDRDRVGSVSPLRLGKKSTFDLSGGQADVPGDEPSLGIADYARAADACRLVRPCMALEPGVERGPTAVEAQTVVVGRERAWGRYRSHVGLSLASATRRGSAFGLRGAAAAHASILAQCSAGMVIIRRSMSCSSAASIALRRTKSLMEVCA